MFNIWAPTKEEHEDIGDWSKDRDDSTMPWYARLNYIDYYSWDAQTDSFNYQWREDFDTYDASKWVPSDNKGWGGNLATYKKE